MPLHDWSNAAGWDGVHNIWIVELLRWIKPRLPEGYRAYIGSTLALTVGAADEKLRCCRPALASRRRPNHLHQHQPRRLSRAGRGSCYCLSILETAVYVATHNRMVAALELVSPRNKDRPTSKAFYLAHGYLGYLHEGAHLLLVDVHRRPTNFSFADALASEMRIQRPALPAPLAVSYQAGNPAANGGRLVGIWQQPLHVGADLPRMPLPLATQCNIPIDLEATYRAAAADVYLS